MPDSVTALDFTTGQLRDVADALSTSRRREYLWLVSATVLTSIPYALVVYRDPFIGIGAIALIAIVQVATALVHSSQTGMGHYVRFLLAGSNPLGMTGAASLMLGGVDTILDWHEDRVYRRQHPWRYLAGASYKLFATPIGLLLLVTELVWDIALGRAWRMIPCKLTEFFSIAHYHNLICPEKSHDIFYADVAYARYRGNPAFYQWNRLRSFVFELRHYQHEVEAGRGVPETNLFRQDAISAYCTLRRLKLEPIEVSLADYFSDNISQFPVPSKLAHRLIDNARPIDHYLRMLQEIDRATPDHAIHGGRNACQGTANSLSRDPFHCFVSNWADSVASHTPATRTLTWWLLRLLDTAPADASHPEDSGVPIQVDCTQSRYVDTSHCEILQQLRILEPFGQGEWRVTTTFWEALSRYVASNYRRLTTEETASEMLRPVPSVLHIGTQRYTFRTRQGRHLT